METAIDRAKEWIELVNQYEKGIQLIDLVALESGINDNAIETEKTQQKASIQSAIEYLRTAIGYLSER